MQTFAGMPLDRFKRALAAFVRELFPTLDYLGLYQYSVVAFDVNTQTADLQAIQNAVGLPTPLNDVQLRSAMTFDLPVGATVLVGFEDQNPANYYIANLDKYANAGFVPAWTGLAGALPTDVAPVGGRVARVGDAVGPFLITTGSTKVGSR